MLSSCRSSSASQEPLLIATAANMQYAIREIATVFSTQTNTPTELIIGSSGKLTAQIKAGAPYHIFISADPKYPAELKQAQFTTSDATIFASGQLILWTTNEDLTPSLDLVVDPQIKHVALANPGTAPYGAAAVAVLEYYNLENTISEKLVYGESISQTNQFIHSGSADIGFTALSTIHAPNLKNLGKWIPINPESYHLVEQSMVTLNNSGIMKETADAFSKFLSSPPARQILRKHGYEVD